MRWRHVPLACSKIPAEYVEERGWCRELQALKAFVWVEWVLGELMKSTCLFSTEPASI